MAKRSANTIDMPIKEEERWRVEDDMRMLMQAETIRKDPKRMAKVQAMAKQKLLDMASLAGDSGKQD